MEIAARVQNRPGIEEIAERFAATPGSACVFTREQARDLGVSDVQLHRWCAAGRLRRLRRGIYAIPLDEPNSAGPHVAAIVARAAQLRGAAVVAHISAAALHGLRLPYASQVEESRLFVLRAPDVASMQTTAQLVVLPAQFEPEHVTQLHGINVTSLERTALDVMRNEPFERALVVADHALALGADLAVMYDIAQTMTGWPGTRVFRPALECANPLAESGLESTVRAVALASGLPAPELQRAVHGDSGALYRFDLCWPEQQLALEVDGRDKYVDREALVAEKRRTDDIEATGYRVERIMYDEVLADDRRIWHRVARKLGVALQPYDPEWHQSPRWDDKHSRRQRRRHHRP